MHATQSEGTCPTWNRMWNLKKKSIKSTEEKRHDDYNALWKISPGTRIKETSMAQTGTESRKIGNLQLSSRKGHMVAILSGESKLSGMIFRNCEMVPDSQRHTWGCL